MILKRSKPRIYIIYLIIKLLSRQYSQIDSCVRPQKYKKNLKYKYFYYFCNNIFDLTNCVPTQLLIFIMIMRKSFEKIRIKDIAVLAGVSEGTVDRVLHNRGNVSEKSRVKIEKALSQIEYKPNVYASALAQKKRLHFICIIPFFNKGDYWEKVALGVKQAQEEVSMFNVTIEIIHFDQYDHFSSRNAFDSSLKILPDGVIFPPFFRDESLVYIQKLNDAKIPFVFLDSLIPDTKALAYFGQDSYRSGEIAAKLLTSLLKEDASIAMFHTYRIGNFGGNQTMERKKGFLNYMNEYHPNCKTYPIELNTTNHEQNVIALENLLVQNPEISGAIVFNSLTYMVTDYLKKINRTDIKIIGYDVLERNREAMKQDEISFLIAQRPDQQGYLGVKALCEALLFNQPPKQINYMPIDIVVKENVEYV